ncbi:hypothetical protein Q9966_015428 [Columba livia]|nr:hypothetical protein Q9966_015428 [Columba livia]
MGNGCYKSMCYRVRISVMCLQAISKDQVDVPPNWNLIPVSPVGSTKVLNSPVTLSEITAEVTYADLRFTTLGKSQDQELQTARAKDSPGLSSCWQLATVALGVFCLSSVVTAGVLTARWILQGSTRPLETAVTNKPYQVFFCFQGNKCIPCPKNWLQYGENCYHFSNEWKTWQESKDRCSALESRLLKTDFTMESEQSYSSYSFWIGLSRNGSEGPWLWENGSGFSRDLRRKRSFETSEGVPERIFRILKDSIYTYDKPNQGLITNLRYPVMKPKASQRSQGFQSGKDDIYAVLESETREALQDTYNVTTCWQEWFIEALLISVTHSYYRMENVLMKQRGEMDGLQSQTTEDEVMIPCLGLLANLRHHNLPVQAKMKSLTSEGVPERIFRILKDSIYTYDKPNQGLITNLRYPVMKPKASQRSQGFQSGKDDIYAVLESETREALQDTYNVTTCWQEWFIEALLISVTHSYYRMENVLMKQRGEMDGLQSQTTEDEVMIPCLGLLANLRHHNLPVQAKMKSLTSEGVPERIFRILKDSIYTYDKPNQGLITNLRYPVMKPKASQRSQGFQSGKDDIYAVLESETREALQDTYNVTTCWQEWFIEALLISVTHSYYRMENVLMKQRGEMDGLQSQTTEDEVMIPCLGLLANLRHHNLPVQAKMKSLTSEGVPERIFRILKDSIYTYDKPNQGLITNLRYPVMKPKASQRSQGFQSGKDDIYAVLESETREALQDTYNVTTCWQEWFIEALLISVTHSYYRMENVLMKQRGEMDGLQSQTTEDEVMIPCLGLLANLRHHNLPVQAKMKSLTSEGVPERIFRILKDSIYTYDKPNQGLITNLRYLVMKPKASQRSQGFQSGKDDIYAVLESETREALQDTYNVTTCWQEWFIEALLISVTHSYYRMENVLMKQRGEMDGLQSQTTEDEVMIPCLGLLANLRHHNLPVQAKMKSLTSEGVPERIFRILKDSIYTYDKPNQGLITNLRYPVMKPKASQRSQGFQSGKDDIYAVLESETREALQDTYNVTTCWQEWFIEALLISVTHSYYRMENVLMKQRGEMDGLQSQTTEDEVMIPCLGLLANLRHHNLPVQAKMKSLTSEGVPERIFRILKDSIYTYDKPNQGLITNLRYPVMKPKASQRSQGFQSGKDDIYAVLESETREALQDTYNVTTCWQEWFIEALLISVTHSYYRMENVLMKQRGEMDGLQSQTTEDEVMIPCLGLLANLRHHNLPVQAKMKSLTSEGVPERIFRILKDSIYTYDKPNQGLITNLRYPVMKPKASQRSQGFQSGKDDIYAVLESETREALQDTYNVTTCWQEWFIEALLISVTHSYYRMENVLMKQRGEMDGLQSQTTEDEVMIPCLGLLANLRHHNLPVQAKMKSLTSEGVPERIFRILKDSIYTYDKPNQGLITNLRYPVMKPKASQRSQGFQSGKDDIYAVLESETREALQDTYNVTTCWQEWFIEALLISVTHSYYRMENVLMKQRGEMDGLQSQTTEDEVMIPCLGLLANLRHHNLPVQAKMKSLTSEGVPERIFRILKDSIYTYDKPNQGLITNLRYPVMKPKASQRSQGFQSGKDDIYAVLESETREALQDTYNVTTCWQEWFIEALLISVTHSYYRMENVLMKQRGEMDGLQSQTTEDEVMIPCLGLLANLRHHNLPVQAKMKSLTSEGVPERIFRILKDSIYTYDKPNQGLITNLRYPVMKPKASQRSQGFQSGKDDIYAVLESETREALQDTYNVTTCWQEWFIEALLISVTHSYYSQTTEDEVMIPCLGLLANLRHHNLPVQAKMKSLTSEGVPERIFRILKDSIYTYNKPNQGLITNLRYPVMKPKASQRSQGFQSGKDDIYAVLESETREALQDTYNVTTCWQEWFIEALLISVTHSYYRMENVLMKQRGEMDGLQSQTTEDEVMIPCLGLLANLRHHNLPVQAKMKSLTSEGVPERIFRILKDSIYTYDKPNQGLITNLRYPVMKPKASQRSQGFQSGKDDIYAVLESETREALQDTYNVTTCWQEWFIEALLISVTHSYYRMENVLMKQRGEMDGLQSQTTEDEVMIPCLGLLANLRHHNLPVQAKMKSLTSEGVPERIFRILKDSIYTYDKPNQGLITNLRYPVMKPKASQRSQGFQSGKDDIYAVLESETREALQDTYNVTTCWQEWFIEALLISVTHSYYRMENVLMKQRGEMDGLQSQTTEDEVMIPCLGLLANLRHHNLPVQAKMKSLTSEGVPERIFRILKDSIYTYDKPNQGLITNLRYPVMKPKASQRSQGFQSGKDDIYAVLESETREALQDTYNVTTCWQEWFIEALLISVTHSYYRMENVLMKQRGEMDGLQSQTTEDEVMIPCLGLLANLRHHNLPVQAKMKSLTSEGVPERIFRILKDSIYTYDKPNQGLITNLHYPVMKPKASQRSQGFQSGKDDIYAVLESETREALQDTYNVTTCWQEWFIEALLISVTHSYYRMENVLMKQRGEMDGLQSQTTEDEVMIPCLGLLANLRHHNLPVQAKMKSLTSEGVPERIFRILKDSIYTYDKPNQGLITNLRYPVMKPKASQRSQGFQSGKDDIYAVLESETREALQDTYNVTTCWQEWFIEALLISVTHSYYRMENVLMKQRGEMDGLQSQTTEDEVMIPCLGLLANLRHHNLPVQAKMKSLTSEGVPERIFRILKDSIYTYDKPNQGLITNLRYPVMKPKASQRSQGFQSGKDDIYAVLESETREALQDTYNVTTCWQEWFIEALLISVTHSYYRMENVLMKQRGEMDGLQSQTTEDEVMIPCLGLLANLRHHNLPVQAKMKSLTSEGVPERIFRILKDSIYTYDKPNQGLITNLHYPVMKPKASQRSQGFQSGKDDIYAASVFVDLRKYFREHVPGWQEEFAKNLSVVVFVYDGRELKRKVEAD